MQGRHKAVCVVVLLLLPSLHAALIGQPASVDVAIATTAEPSPLAEQPSSGGEALVLVEQQSTTNTDSRPPVQTAQAVCSGTPPSSSYVTWTCFEGTADGAECAGSCVQGTKAPYGPPLAVCSGGAYTVVRTCMAGMWGCMDSIKGLNSDDVHASIMFTRSKQSEATADSGCNDKPPTHNVWVRCDGCGREISALATRILPTPTAGGTYNFDDVSIDGGLPGRFLGLNWSGLRVTRAATYTACDGVNGFKYGVLSAPNVAFSLEVGAAKGDLMNYVSVGAATPQQKISVLGFSATAAWQVSRWEGG